MQIQDNGIRNLVPLAFGTASTRSLHQINSMPFYQAQEFLSPVVSSAISGSLPIIQWGLDDDGGPLHCYAYSAYACPSSATQAVLTSLGVFLGLLCMHTE